MFIPSKELLVELNATFMTPVLGAAPTAALSAIVHCGSCAARARSFLCAAANGSNETIGPRKPHFLTSDPNWTVLAPTSSRNCTRWPRNRSRSVFSSFIVALAKPTSRPIARNAAFIVVSNRDFEMIMGVFESAAPRQLKARCEKALLTVIHRLSRRSLATRRTALGFLRPGGRTKSHVSRPPLSQYEARGSPKQGNRKQE